MTDLLRSDGDDGTCMMARCSEADLLPTLCTKCNRRFCTKHIAPHEHNCAAHARSNARTVECPMCTQAVAVRPGESPDAAVMAHMETGCAPQAVQQAATNWLNMCSVHSCTRNEVQPITCEYCRQTYCVEHRHYKSHQCRAKPVTPPMPKAQPAATPSPPPQTSPASSGASLVAKKAPLYVPLAAQAPRNEPKTAFHLPPSTSRGVDPAHALVLVHVFAPRAPGKKPRSFEPAFFSLPPSAAIGRVLDGVCTALDVHNDNHRTRDDAQKLWVHALPPHGSAGASVCLPPSLTVRDCLESFGAMGGAGGAAPPRVIITRGNDLPAEVAADLGGGSAAAAVARDGSPEATSASPAAAAAAGGTKKSAKKKSDEGCVAA